MRNWMRTLRPASFRGIRFQVDDEALPKTGRRVAVHEYTKAETHGTEDMGRLPREFRVKAHLHGDSADADVRRLVAACSTKGAATLVLPFFGPQQVRCTGCQPSHGRDKLGWVTVDLDFVEAGGDGGDFPVMALGDRIAASALDGLADAVSGAIEAFVPGEILDLVDLAADVGVLPIP